jgi:predicted RNase H-like nuclease (RuvC/YqgF family)
MRRFLPKSGRVKPSGPTSAGSGDPEKAATPPLTGTPGKAVLPEQSDKNADAVASPAASNLTNAVRVTDQKPADASAAPPDKPFSDPAKERLRLANKVLQEEIEDEKDKLEALQKKLKRLKNSGLSVAEGDPELARLRQQNRLLQQQLKHLREDVRAAEEEVQPFKHALLKGAGAEIEDEKDKFEDRQKSGLGSRSP